MIQLRTIFIITILIFSTLLAKTQIEGDIEQFEALFETNHTHQQFDFVVDSHNEAQFLVNSLFLFYKNFISSQDISHCTFHPSCSEYAYQCIEKKGLFIGMLGTFDRLTRCNPFSPEKYSVDPNSKRLYDPVE